MANRRVELIPLLVGEKTLLKREVKEKRKFDPIQDLPISMNSYRGREEKGRGSIYDQKGKKGNTP